MIHLLVVDDDEDTKELLCQSLSKEYDVTACHRGLDALLSILSHIKAGNPFQFLLLDCAMPHLDGFTLARIVRLVEETGLTKPCKIGLYTAHHDVIERSTLLNNSDINYYWRKPEDTVQLPVLIRTALMYEPDIA